MGNETHKSPFKKAEKMQQITERNKISQKSCRQGMIRREKQWRNAKPRRPPPRVVHNPAILIPLVEKNGNPATFVVIHTIFENSGEKKRD